MRILVTNDDGIGAPGIHALVQSLQSLGEITVVAPERPRSASGHAITLHKPLRLSPYTFAGADRAFACNGTPSDCVTLGIDIVLKRQADLVVSGINAGPNLGWDLTYSGTVSAAMEGAILGMPSIALSVAAETSEIDYTAAAAFAAKLAAEVGKRGMERWTLINVNVPALPVNEVHGVTITHQGRRQYVDRVVERTDPSGRPYYWLGGSLGEDVPDPGSDVHAVLEGKISVTPVHLDLTAGHLLSDMRSWDL
jgi:5'-nucleotidase